MKNANNTKQITNTTGFLKHIIVAIAVVFSIGNNVVSAGNKDKDKGPDVLQVKVKPTINGALENDVVIKLYSLNELIESNEGGKQAKMFIKLKKNRMYTIEVSKPGYITRAISISTHLKDDVELSPVFKYDMEVELVKEVAGVDKHYFEFPIAVIAYSSILDRFEYNKNYTANIKYEQNKEIQRVLGKSLSKN